MVSIWHGGASLATHNKNNKRYPTPRPIVCVQAGICGSGRGVPELTVEAMIWHDTCNGQHNTSLVVDLELYHI